MCNKYRVITFQSKEVADILLNTGYYLADKNKAREGSFAALDFIACSGNCPIWVFQHPNLKYDSITVKPLSDLLEICRCEMSMDSLDGLHLIELLLDKQPIVGKAHNASSMACVIPYIDIKQVLSISSLIKTEWYMHTITPYYVKDGAMFAKQIVCDKSKYNQDSNKLLSLIKYKNADEYYL